MNLDEFRSILGSSGLDVWAFIETAITVASLDYGDEFKSRRDGIIGKLYADVAPICRSCSADRRREPSNSPATPVSVDGGDDVVDHMRVEKLFEEDEEESEESRILAIKEQIEDPNQSESSLVDLLQGLVDMDITFKALQETDIGRHVNQLRKHPSSDIRRLVKLLVRKWKDLVDEWVRFNTPGEAQASSLITEGDSPNNSIPKNHQQNGHHHQVPDFSYSPNPHNGTPGLEKNNSEPEPPKLKTAPARRDPPARPSMNASTSASASPNRRKEAVIDPARLASARKRLQENYKEAQNAKKQRTIQVMDIHEIPKPKNAFFARNKGGFPGRH